MRFWLSCLLVKMFIVSGGIGFASPTRLRGNQSKSTHVSQRKSKNIISSSATLHRSVLIGASGHSYKTIPIQEKYKNEKMGRDHEGKLLASFDSLVQLKQNESSRYEVFVSDGRLVDNKGNRIDTTTTENGRGIFVMTRFGRIFMSTDQAFGKMHHSSFTSGGRLAAAGEMLIANGNVVMVNNQSGHYLPSKAIHRQLFQEIKSRGVKLGIGHSVARGHLDERHFKKINVTHRLFNGLLAYLAPRRSFVDLKKIRITQRVSKLLNDEFLGKDVNHDEVASGLRVVAAIAAKEGLNHSAVEIVEKAIMYAPYNILGLKLLAAIGDDEDSIRAIRLVHYFDHGTKTRKWARDNLKKRFSLKSLEKKLNQLDNAENGKALRTQILLLHRHFQEQKTELVDRILSSESLII